MAKKDKIKEQIGWLKIIFGLLFATDFSIIGYLFNNFEKLGLLKLILIVMALIILTFSLYLINKTAMKKINELEDLE